MSVGATAEPTYSFDATPGRLPKAVVPIHYTIALEPELDSLALKGEELVDVEVREPTARLVVNAVGMTLGAATIALSGQCARSEGSKRVRSASARATQAPVTAAVRVPPSAWMTSQSSQIVRSPSFDVSVTARNERPMMR